MWRISQRPEPLWPTAIYKRFLQKGKSRGIAIQQQLNTALDRHTPARWWSTLWTPYGSVDTGWFTLNLCAAPRKAGAWYAVIRSKSKMANFPHRGHLFEERPLELSKAITFSVLQQGKGIIPLSFSALVLTIWTSISSDDHIWPLCIMPTQIRATQTLAHRSGLGTYTPK